MSEPLDDELRTWMDDWREEATEPAAPEAAAKIATLARSVRRRSLGLKLLTVAEVVFAAGMLAVLAGVAVRERTPADVATMAGLGLLTLWALAFALWNRRGLWAPSAETSAAFLDLALARCRRRRRGLTAGWALLAAEVALFIPWIHHRLHLGASPTAAEVLTAYGFLATMAGTTAVILVWLGRRTRRELRELEGLARGLGAAD